MNRAEIVDQCTDFVSHLLRDQLPKDFHYHNLQHTLDVKSYCERFGQTLSVSEADMFLLQIAALFHDTGYLRTYDQHEAASQDIAREHLQEINLPTEQIDQVCSLIEATIVQRQPENLLQQIIKDADLNNIGKEDFQVNSENLRHEWKVFLKEEYKEREWLRSTLNFLKEHQFYTSAAQELLGEQKKANMKSLKKQLKKMKKAKSDQKEKMEQKEKSNKKEKAPQGPIGSSRTAQMMFKTSLRNHIDLTNIADNKANMMLSINAIVISITMPLLASNIEGNTFLVIPASFLLLTSVLSIIFATLATRPIRMTGRTNMENIRQGKTNLFFFGNFFRMSNKDYQVGIQETITNNDLLENTIVNDLFFLGKALGEKYNQLRICYGIFMIGITLTVAAFAVSFLYARTQM
ncbi:MAG: Pycsar system effector family protein [Bacteroidota bacterium]